MLNCLAASPNRKALQDLCDENEESDDKSREKFTYRQSCDDGDGHRELHRHTALGNIFVGFMEDGKTADDRANHANRDDVWIPLLSGETSAGRAQAL